MADILRHLFLSINVLFDMMYNLKYSSYRCSVEEPKCLFSFLRRENRKVEYALACVLTELRAGRNLAVSVRRNEKIDGCLHAHNYRHATSDVKRIVADVSASRGRHIDRCRNIRRDYAACRHAHYDVLVDTYGTRTRACHAVCVGVGNLNGYRYGCRNSG